MKLIALISDLMDEQLNVTLSSEWWWIAQILYHLYSTEKEIAQFVLQSLKTISKKVEERDVSFIEACNVIAKAAEVPPEAFFSKKEITQLLEASRFQYTQAIFNETHKRSLTEKSVEHPGFGEISLKNMLDVIWLHEEQHLQQLKEIKQQLVKCPN